VSRQVVTVKKTEVAMVAIAAAMPVEHNKEAADLAVKVISIKLAVKLM